MRPAASAKDIRVETRLDPRIDTDPGDPDRLAAGGVESPLQRDQVSPPRAGASDVVLERVDSHFELDGSRHGQGHQVRVPPLPLRALPAGRWLPSRGRSAAGARPRIARHLVELHGGTSKPRALARERCQLQSADPAQGRNEDTRAHEARKAPRARISHLLSGLRVLVATTAGHVRGPRSGPAGSRCRGTACQSAAEALAELDTWWPDVLLSGHRLAREDGYSLIRRVRAQEARHGRAIAAVALTAYARARTGGRRCRPAFRCTSQADLRRRPDP